jgi:hypothetical protein
LGALVEAGVGEDAAGRYYPFADPHLVGDDSARRRSHEVSDSCVRVADVDIDLSLALGRLDDDLRLFSERC